MDIGYYKKKNHSCRWPQQLESVTSCKSKPYNMDWYGRDAVSRVRRQMELSLQPNSCFQSLNYAFSFPNQDSSKIYTTHISYLEIYNECGYDLLDPRHEASKLEDLPWVAANKDQQEMVFRCFFPLLPLKWAAFLVSIVISKYWLATSFRNGQAW